MHLQYHSTGVSLLSLKSKHTPLMIYLLDMLAAHCGKFICTCQWVTAGISVVGEHSPRRTGVSPLGLTLKSRTEVCVTHCPCTQRREHCASSAAPSGKAGPAAVRSYLCGRRIDGQVQSALHYLLVRPSDSPAQCLTSLHRMSAMVQPWHAGPWRSSGSHASGS
jgi:hypothetical protein